MFLGGAKRVVRRPTPVERAVPVCSVEEQKGLKLAMQLGKRELLITWPVPVDYQDLRNKRWEMESLDVAEISQGYLVEKYRRLGSLKDV